jgi:hypothetical protein
MFGMSGRANRLSRSHLNDPGKSDISAVVHGYPPVNWPLLSLNHMFMRVVAESLELYSAFNMSATGNATLMRGAT